jgi:hypothetical protein
MSWLFSRALVEEYSEDTCLDGEQSALLNVIHMPQLYSSNVKMMEFCRRFQSGMMCKHLTDEHGEELLTLYLAAFPVKPIPKRRLEKIQQMTYGQRCGESWQMSLPGTFLPKTSANLLLIKRPMILNRWVTKPNAFPFPRRTWVVITFGKGFGYLATPTATANQSAPSMMKHPGCRNFVTVFGNMNPTAYEWLMGWPVGWTDLKPLGMVKFQQWQNSHGKF